MGNVVPITGYRSFTRSEVNEILPIIKRITDENEKAIQKVLNEQRHGIKSGATNERIEAQDKQVQDLLMQWGSKICKLGGHPFQQGYVGFDSGYDFFVWHSPEETIQYYSAYTTPPWNRSLLE